MYNMNSGYSGWSMSKNAVAAYDSGEKPKSKWTKKTMLAAIADYCEEYDLALDLDVSKLTKAELFERFFEWSSWHHTGKFCNVTDFYQLDERELMTIAHELSATEIAERNEIRRKAKEQEEAENKAYLARIKAENERIARETEAYMQRFGYAPTSVYAFMQAHPEACVVRYGKKNKRQVVDYTIDGCTRTAPLEWVKYETAYGFSDIA